MESGNPMEFQVTLVLGCVKHSALAIAFAFAFPIIELSHCP